MPVAQYVYPAKDMRISRNMPVPKKVGELFRGWYAEAYKALKVLPLVSEVVRGDFPGTCQHGRLWKISEEPDISPQMIKFTLVNDIGERSYLVIDRTKDSFGY